MPAFAKNSQHRTHITSDLKFGSCEEANVVQGYRSRQKSCFQRPNSAGPVSDIRSLAQRRPVTLLGYWWQMGGMVDFQPRRVLLHCQRPQTFRKTREADVIAFAAEPPGRVQRTRAHAELVADFHGSAGAHPAAQTSQQGVLGCGD